jgi:hypothetical protein
MKLTPSLAGTLSGSMGGMTASRNRGGQYLRRRVVPVNPNSPRQQAARASFTNAIQDWTGVLTDAQRTSWATYAANTPRTDVLGQALVLTGQQAYLAANAPRQTAAASGLTVTAALPTINNAPTVFNTGEAVTSILNFEVDGTEISLSADFGVLASDVGIGLLFVGSPQNPSINFFKGPYQLAAAATFNASDAGVTFTALDQSLPAEWASDHVFMGGERVPVRLVQLFEDGRVSLAFQQLTLLEIAPP